MQPRCFKRAKKTEAAFHSPGLILLYYITNSAQIPTPSPLPAMSTARMIAVIFTHFLPYIGLCLRFHNGVRLGNKLIRFLAGGFF